MIELMHFHSERQWILCTTWTTGVREGERGGGKGRAGRRGKKGGKWKGDKERGRKRERERESEREKEEGRGREGGRRDGGGEGRREEKNEGGRKGRRLHYVIMHEIPSSKIVRQLPPLLQCHIHVHPCSYRQREENVCLPLTKGDIHFIHSKPKSKFHYHGHTCNIALHHNDVTHRHLLHEEHNEVHQRCTPISGGSLQLEARGSCVLSQWTYHLEE